MCPSVNPVSFRLGSNSTLIWGRQPTSFFFSSNVIKFNYILIKFINYFFNKKNIQLVDFVINQAGSRFNLLLILYKVKLFSKRYKVQVFDTFSAFRFQKGSGLPIPGRQVVETEICPKGRNRKKYYFKNSIRFSKNLLKKLMTNVLPIYSVNARFRLKGNASFACNQKLFYSASTLKRAFLFYKNLLFLPSSLKKDELYKKILINIRFISKLFFTKDIFTNNNKISGRLQSKYVYYLLKNKKKPLKSILKKKLSFFFKVSKKKLKRKRRGSLVFSELIWKNKIKNNYNNNESFKFFKIFMISRWFDSYFFQKLPIYLSQADFLKTYYRGKDLNSDANIISNINGSGNNILLPNFFKSKNYYCSNNKNFFISSKRFSINNNNSHNIQYCSNFGLFYSKFENLIKIRSIFFFKGMSENYKLCNSLLIGARIKKNFNIYKPFYLLKNSLFFLKKKLTIEVLLGNTKSTKSWAYPTLISRGYRRVIAYLAYKRSLKTRERLIHRKQNYSVNQSECSRLKIVENSFINRMQKIKDFITMEDPRGRRLTKKEFFIEKKILEYSAADFFVSYNNIKADEHNEEDSIKEFNKLIHQYTTNIKNFSFFGLYSTISAVEKNLISKYKSKNKRSLKNNINLFNTSYKAFFFNKKKIKTPRVLITKNFFLKNKIKLIKPIKKNTIFFNRNLSFKYKAQNRFISQYYFNLFKKKPILDRFTSIRSIQNKIFFMGISSKQHYSVCKKRADKKKMKKKYLKNKFLNISSFKFFFFKYNKYSLKKYLLFLDLTYLIKKNYINESIFSKDIFMKKNAYCVSSFYFNKIDFNPWQNRLLQHTNKSNLNLETAGVTKFLSKTPPSLLTNLRFVNTLSIFFKKYNRSFKKTTITSYKGKDKVIVKGRESLNFKSLNFFFKENKYTKYLPYSFFFFLKKYTTKNPLRLASFSKVVDTLLSLAYIYWVNKNFLPKVANYSILRGVFRIKNYLFRFFGKKFNLINIITLIAKLSKNFKTCIYKLFYYLSKVKTVNSYENTKFKKIVKKYKVYCSKFYLKNIKTNLFFKNQFLSYMSKIPLYKLKKKTSKFADKVTNAPRDDDYFINKIINKRTYKKNIAIHRSQNKINIKNNKLKNKLANTKKYLLNAAWNKHHNLSNFNFSKALINNLLFKKIGLVMIPSAYKYWNSWVYRKGINNAYSVLNSNLSSIREQVFKNKRINQTYNPIYSNHKPYPVELNYKIRYRFKWMQLNNIQSKKYIKFAQSYQYSYTPGSSRILKIDSKIIKNNILSGRISKFLWNKNKIFKKSRITKNIVFNSFYKKGEKSKVSSKKKFYLTKKKKVVKNFINNKILNLFLLKAGVFLVKKKTSILSYVSLFNNSAENYYLNPGLFFLTKSNKFSFSKCYYNTSNNFYNKKILKHTVCYYTSLNYLLTKTNSIGGLLGSTIVGLTSSVSKLLLVYSNIKSEVINKISNRLIKKIKFFFGNKTVSKRRTVKNSLGGIESSIIWFFKKQEIIFLEFFFNRLFGIAFKISIFWAYNLLTYAERVYSRLGKKSVFKQAHIPKRAQVFCRNFINLFIYSVKFCTLSSVSSYFAQEFYSRTRQKIFLITIEKVLRYLNCKTLNFVGFCMLVCGKLSRRPRAKKSFLIKGIQPALSRLDLKVNYIFRTVRCSFGSYGVKMWLYYI